MESKGFGNATILVTGGAGFIGSHFIRHILAAHPKARVINFDKLTYCGNLNNLRDVEKNPRYVFVKGDITDRNFVERAFQKYKPQYLINFAASTHVDRSVHINPREFVETNVNGVHTLLEEVKGARRIKKFVQVSSDEVYGALPLGSWARFTESSPLDPSSPYSSSKAAGDLLCLSYFRTFGVPVVVTRSGNNFGSHQYPEKLIPFFILRLGEGKTLPLYGDGRHVRDWLYVGDHCRAIERTLLKGRSGEIYNIGADNERSNREIARRILRHFNAPRSRIELVADRPGHDRRYALDASKIKKELGWQPIAVFEEEFTKTVQWYHDNQRWIERVKKRADAINPHIK